LKNDITYFIVIFGGSMTVLMWCQPVIQSAILMIGSSSVYSLATYSIYRVLSWLGSKPRGDFCSR